MKCVLQVRLSIPSCEMWTTHLECVWELAPVSKNKCIGAKEVEPFNINKYVCDVVRLCESESELCVMWGIEPRSKTDVGMSHLGCVWHLGLEEIVLKESKTTMLWQICVVWMHNPCLIHIWSQIRCTFSSPAVKMGICADDLASRS